ncbi:MAG TPA: DHA2 family efflux MFS transporter permease subunit [Xanthobacteraceae bacterium]|nr:DHA2 family efflux MFS transporter permease subunit [Xanthobacteraceae bacterium]
MTPERLIPLIVAVALFMENMDSTVIATSLPAIAADIGSRPLELKLAITSYLLALAIFIPASGWVADRFGARTIFRTAIAVFMIGSIGCALSQSLWHFVIARFFQGMGGAMMSPVGRLVLIRTVGKRKLVNAMALLTMPALVGPMLGPALGGFITTYASWHWIFLINIPIGLLGIVLVSLFFENVRAEITEPFDLFGLVLIGLGVGGLAFGMTVTGIRLVPAGVVIGLVAFGAAATFAYVVRARGMAAPVIDLTLFRLVTFRAGVVGGFIFRIGAGALPFLLPLLMQLGFGMTPFQSGLITLSTAVGAMMMKSAVPHILKRVGFRNVLTWNALVASVMLAACAAFTYSTPVPVMIAVLLAGGFFRSLQFTSVNVIAYAEVEPARMSRATSLVAVAQQLSQSVGVAVGAMVLETILRLNGQQALAAEDFPPAFLVVGLISVSSILLFARLPPDAGAEMADRGPTAAGSHDEQKAA